MVDDNAWPPKQPTSFTSLLLIHRQGDHIKEEVTAMAEMMYRGNISEVALVTGEHVYC